MQNADVADEPACSSGTDCLHHEFLRANALKHGISPDSFRQVFDSRHAFLATFGYDVGRAELPREFLPRFVAAHRDDSLSSHLLGREHSEQSDRAISDDYNGRARLHIGGVRGEPPGAQHVRCRE